MLSTSLLMLLYVPCAAYRVVRELNGLNATSGSRNPECKAPENLGCNHLAGNCCPHDGDGAMLSCCNQHSESQPSPSLPDATPSKPSHPDSNKTGPSKLHFHVYRARGYWDITDSPITFADTNYANAAGVLRYIHNEVVGRLVAADARPPKCERKFGIDRIERYTVTMKTTKEVFNVRHGNFAPFFAMDSGNCTVPKCKEFYEEKGYVVGCQKQPVGAFYYPDALWYSFPSKGACYFVSGSHDCTFHVSKDGYVKLDELAGITPEHEDYKDFCMKDGVEFNGPLAPNDDGVTLDFWRSYTDVERNKARTAHMLKLFDEKLGYNLDDPTCDTF